jgi:hypothetical protein
VKLELQFHGKNFAEQYDHIDVVFGGDHGARRFRAVVQVIFRSKNNANVPTSSITLQVGHINAAKDTYEVLEGTVARELNEGLWRIVDKVLVVHFAENHDPVIVFAVEAPAAEERHNNWAMFGIQALISGDLAFFSTILGKPNMSPIWCNWCMLSKQAWSVAGHAPGDRWAIDKIQQIRHNVEVCGMRDDPSNIMGCIKTPLIDAVPIENFILSVLHIIIGIGNTLVVAFYEWIEWRVEKLSQQEVIHRNTVVYAELKLEQEKESYDSWLNNEGVLLADKIAQKKGCRKNTLLR